jgi:putative hydrolase
MQEAGRMKTWERYRDYLMTGEWHIHTQYSDGKNSISEICRRAVELGVPLLVFTDHLNEDRPFDMSGYLREIGEAKREFPLKILSGCEIELYPDGSLSAGDRLLKQVDYTIVSFHSSSESIGDYYYGLLKAFEHPSVNTWGHPGAYLRQTDLLLACGMLEEIFARMAEEKVALELNKRYNVPPRDWRELALKYNVAMINGSDIHSIRDFTKGKRRRVLSNR